MKKLLFVFIALLVQLGLMAQKKVIEGNGKLVTRDVSISSFDALKASGIYELKISQGNSESVKIEADENLLDLFEVKNQGNQLVIETKKMKNKNLKTKNKMRVYITFKNLKSMELATVGNVSSDDQLSFNDLEMNNRCVGNVDLKLTANKIHIKNTSVGDVKLDGKADEAVVKNTGVGSLKAGSFVVQTMNIENTGVGGADVNAEKDLKVKDSFLGKVKNKGNAPVRKMNKVRV